MLHFGDQKILKQKKKSHKPLKSVDAVKISSKHW